MAKTINISGRLHSKATGNVVAGANEILDDAKGKKQSAINQEVDEALATHENAINALHSQNYVTVEATSETTDVTTLLPEEGSADTIYRVGSWDGSQYAADTYSEYAWNGSDYRLLDTKQTGIDDVPTAGSNKLVKSGGVFDGILDLTHSLFKPVETEKVLNLKPDSETGGFIETSSSNCYYIPVREGQIVYFSGSNASAKAVIFCFSTVIPEVDAEFTNYEGYSVKEVTKYFVAPYDGYFTAYHGNSTYTNQVFKVNNSIGGIDEHLNNIDSQLQNENLVTSTPFTFSKTGYFIRTDGTVGESTNWFQSNIVAVRKGQIIVLKAVGTGSGNNVLGALTDANGTFFTPVIITRGNDISNAETTYYSVKEDGYIVLQRYKISGDIYLKTDSKRIFDIEERLDLEEEHINSVESKCTDVENILVIEHHDEVRDFTTTNRGYFINNSGNHSTTPNWQMSNPIHLNTKEKIIVSCVSTSDGYRIIFLTDANESFYTPVVKAISTYRETYEYTAIEDCYVIVQGRSNSSVDISIISDSGRIVDIEKNVKSLEDTIYDLVDITPDYVKDERDRVCRKLLGLSNSNVSIVAFNTDQHFTYPYNSSGSNPVYAMRGVNSIVDIAKRVGLDLVVFGGDVAGYDGGVSNSINGIIGEVNYLNRPFIELNVPCISLPGNHDAFQNNDNMTAQGMYNAHFRRSKWLKNLIHSGTDNCDCMLDDTDKKIRYIFVDVDSRNGRSESYSDFLANALTTMDNSYKALLFSHQPLTNEFDGEIYKYGSDEETNPKNAFANPVDLHSTINSHASDIIACICGHAHCDAWGMNSSGVLFIETTSAVHTRARFEHIPWRPIYNNQKETAFDFFVIDTVNQTIEAVRYGQGTDRKWKYKGNDAGLIGYKNCINGTVSIPSLTLVFTNDSDNTDVVTASADTEGFYEVYLTLNATYNITCSGYTLNTESVVIDGHNRLDIEATVIED